MKIIVGLSGGVDSAVSAWLLKNQGYDVEGLFIKSWEGGDDACTAAADLRDALAVCEHLDIALHVENFSTQYYQQVFRRFLDEYALGRTPNPDILCNREIKFSAFLQQAMKLGADRIATGHYARIVKKSRRHELWQADDKEKDQSYFLHTLDQKQLGSALFPLAHRTKLQVRQQAEKIGLKNHAKKDSTGICFIGKRSFNAFIGTYFSRQPGEIVTTRGTVVGQHDGLVFYTIGQRKGLNIGGHAQYRAEPWYVVDKLIPTNQIVVAQGDSSALYHDRLEIKKMHWISEAVEPGVRLKVRIRHRQPLQACSIDHLNGGHLHIHFDKPQRAISPGQSAVLYDNGRCLGGGVIERRWNDNQCR